ncbi:bifunctional tetrahydrofolate synthase/dihydrofolate synthase [Polynucleobacter sp. HIN10]|uniref:bifunctional tetrahydrofolate synthase/dihydrofolate synthase n=1 Tax=unclassified Polynucleobacter TaxID=2640945 RepID=UPI0025739617|nr:MULTISPECIES: bifunctional tetrahydrofolate synthase/dihydrofolate synthase [unclassified Polynucleobacter]BEI42791.1 bifunctional tetrahydrofolate synthase/dihydrofolate synthase [Polynucleobacter sp. HIN10]BEI44545.1 bifunctional tetrahydrofolate synthase/dihydrofolate synthase [Polynucleobacter sp. HIN11]
MLEPQQSQPILFTNLDEWLSHLETAHPVGIDMGLGRITRVKESLGLKFPCPVITVGGTNGKGSTCAFLESILLAAGYKVACHTSPHLLRFNERARINGADVGDADLLNAFERVEQARCRLSDPPTLTYFEFTTLAIMDLFANAKVDAAILEVGMGGRLDAVNIVDADCAIVTSIDLDHMAYLGNTREAIAFEKAGIFRPKAIAICGDPMPPTSLINHAKEIGADLYLMGKDYSFTGDQQQWGWSGRGKRFSGLGYPALRGANQLLNASAVIAALMALHDRLPVSAQDIRNGLALVELPGRFQVLPGRPIVVLDVAHNPHAAATLAQSIEAMAYHPYTYAVFGAMADKDIEGVLKPMLDIVDYWYCTDLPTPRAASAHDLVKRLQALNKEALVFPNPGAAYQAALDKAGEGDRITVFGSFYTVAGVMAYRNNQAH